MAQRFKADELAVVRDFMRQAKEVFQRQVAGGAAAAEEPPPGKVGWALPSQVGRGSQ